MTVEVPFLAAVAVAGVGAMAGKLILMRKPVLLPYLPQPLIGAMLIAAIVFFLHLARINVQFPTAGAPVDFLVGLITTNMGLHITGKIFRNGLKHFFLFLGAGAVLFFLQLAVNLPLASLSPHVLQTALVGGPLSFVGAPFNLNPPDQTAPLTALFASGFPNLKATAQGTMMIGVLGAVGLAGWLGEFLMKKAAAKPPEPSFDESSKKIRITHFSDQLTALLVLTLSLITLSFLLQAALFKLFPQLKQEHVPVIVLSFLMGAAVRLVYPRLHIGKPFPEQALTVLLIGPTMNLVLTYAVMCIPLYLITQLTPILLVNGLLSVAASLAVALLLFPILRRLVHPYYAAVIATAFFALTTGWGPVAMSFLRHFVHTKGDVEPMPVIMPLNAFYLFPWMVILLIRLLL